jgi:hypothetical protein
MRCQQESVCFRCRATGNNSTTKLGQGPIRFVPNFAQCFPTTSPTTYQKRDLQFRLAVELFYFFIAKGSMISHVGYDALIAYNLGENIILQENFKMLTRDVEEKLFLKNYI